MRKFAVVGLFIFWVFLCVRYYTADVYFKKSQDYLKKGKYSEALVYINKSVNLNPNEPNYYRGRAKILTISLVEKQKPDLKNLIYEDLNKAINLNQNNLVTLRNSVPIYYFLAVKDIFGAMSIENTDDYYISQTKNFYKDFKNKFSNDIGVVTLIAKYEKKLGLIKEYKESEDIVRKIRPDLLNWHESFR